MNKNPATTLLDSVRRRQEGLLKYSLEKPANSADTSVDISATLTNFYFDIDKVLKKLKSLGFTGVSLGCGAIKKMILDHGSHALKDLSIKLQKFDLPISTFHGDFKYNDKEIESDFEIMKTLDPEERAYVNYEVADLDFKALFQSYGNKVGLDQVRLDQGNIVGHDVLVQTRKIASLILSYLSRHNSNRGVLFEVPSGPFTAVGRVEEIDSVLTEISNLFGNREWKFTIDTGHLLGNILYDKGNAKSGQTILGEQMLEIVNKWIQHLGALHIVAAITSTASNFTNDYSKKSGIPIDSLISIDMHGAPDNLAHLEFVKSVRKLLKDKQQKHFEVSEPGPFNSSLAGFGLKGKRQIFSNYIKDIEMYAKLTGVTK